MNTEQDQPSAEELNRLLMPILSLGPSVPDKRMAETVGEGLVLPSTTVILQQRLPREAIAAVHEETLNWIRSVLRSDWLVPDVGERLFAVPEAIQGEDAFIGAWSVRNRTLQIVVTRERLHLVTRVPDSQSGSSDKEKAQGALRLAYELLQLEGEPDPRKWEVREFGGLTLGNQETSFASNWPQTLIFLTDGAGTKFSVLKYKERSSPIEKVSAQRKVIPWFPRESAQ